MLSHVEIRSAQGDLLDLHLDDISSGYIIKSIEGLDPVKATLVSTDFASIDGSQFQSSRREYRNIKFQLGYVPVGNTVRQLRQKLYTYFMPKSTVSLRFFMEDGLIVDTKSRVESFETTLFTSDPAVDISLISFDPDFYNPTPVEILGNTVSTGTMTIIEYEGSVPTGIEFTLEIDRSISALTLYHVSEGVTSNFDFNYAMVAGEVLKINTIPGSKSATLTTSGYSRSVLFGTSPAAIWPQLTPGENQFLAYVDGAPIPYTITYNAKYGGL